MNGKNNSLANISVFELKNKIDQKESFILLDVREKEELDIAKITPCLWIPMDLIAKEYSKIDISLPVVVMCHGGRRSSLVAKFLKKLGYEVSNLEGGIEAWSKNIDPKVPRY